MSPPTSPPTIIRKFSEREGGAGVGICVLEGSAREDSTPLILKARVTLNVSEIYENVLAVTFQSFIEEQYRNILIRMSWHLDSNWDLLGVAENE